MGCVMIDFKVLFVNDRFKVDDYFQIYAVATFQLKNETEGG